jgi:hypothetical protein
MTADVHRASETQDGIVILSREDGEGSRVAYFEILRFAQDDGGRASRIGNAGRRLP